MTGRDAKIFQEILLDVLEQEKRKEDLWERKLEELAPDDDSKDAKDFRQWQKAASDRYDVAARVLNSIEMQHFDIRL